MEVVRRADEILQAGKIAREQGRTIGFVPTMGALHKGHLSLIRRAREESGTVIVSIFVNPLQFGPSEDFERYPRNEGADARAAESEGADLLFAPGAEEIYPDGESTPVDPGPAGRLLEGASRPAYFEGMLTVVDRLFGLIVPDRSYFGEKDWQQLVLVRRMARARHPEIEIVACPTVRERDGLAMSSRNSYLNAEQRVAAASLYEALKGAEAMFDAGERDAQVLVAEMEKRLGSEPLVEPDHAAIVDEETFEVFERIGGRARALIAARIGEARLIDNMRLGG
ncbi:MAG: pantoate--beta-alanine ligase [Actinomycetota bacterium]